MARPVVQAAVIALIFLFVGVATAAAVFIYIPDPGSAPSIYDDFKWSSTSNGFWHVDAIGGSAIIKNSILTVKGDSVELDRRVQTDPNETVVSARVRGIQFHRFAIGLGVYHAGTVGLEFDDDGAKCGRGSNHGWQVDFLQNWHTPPVGKWYYISLSVTNPYPPPKKEPAHGKVKRITLRCSLYDGNGRLLGSMVAKNPPPNGHYVSFDEAYLRTWDSGNNYQVDWLYTGPPSGDPLQRVVKRG